MNAASGVPGMTLNFGQVRGSSIREPWGVMWSPRSGACVIASCVGAPFYRRIPRLLFLSPSSPLASPLVSLLAFPSPPFRAISPPLVFVSLSPSSSPLLLRRVVLRVCASSCTHSRACFLCETRTGRINRLQWEDRPSIRAWCFGHTKPPEVTTDSLGLSVLARCFEGASADSNETVWASGL